VQTYLQEEKGFSLQTYLQEQKGISARTYLAENGLFISNKKTFNGHSL